MNRREDIFGYLLPLKPGTNVIVLTAVDEAGANPRSTMAVLERSDRYRAAITSPAFGAFANGQEVAVSGTVSANGVAATLGAYRRGTGRMKVRLDV